MHVTRCEIGDMKSRAYVYRVKKKEGKERKERKMRYRFPAVVTGCSQIFEAFSRFSGPGRGLEKIYRGGRVLFFFSFFFIRRLHATLLTSVFGHARESRDGSVTPKTGVQASESVRRPRPQKSILRSGRGPGGLLRREWNLKKNESYINAVSVNPEMRAHGSRERLSRRKIDCEVSPV